MQKDIHPGVAAAAIVVLLVIAGFILFRAATHKPDYPGYFGTLRGQVPTGPITREQAAQMGFRGATHKTDQKPATSP